MKFSVDKSSVDEIISVLEDYSTDITAEFSKFSDEIRNISIRSNYNKLLNALKGIIQTYDEIICSGLRKKLIDRWIDDGESLHAFAEDMYMGEESEEAVKRIESVLEDIFVTSNYSEIIDLNFTGEPRVKMEDFQDVEKAFESFSDRVGGICDSKIRYFENNTDDNELYRFLIPIVESIGSGIGAFLGSAKKGIETLGENYEDKMETLKERVDENKNEHRISAVDEELIDLDDSMGAMLMGSTSSGDASDRTMSKASRQTQNSGSKTTKSSALNDGADFMEKLLGEDARKVGDVAKDVASELAGKGLDGKTALTAGAMGAAVGLAAGAVVGKAMAGDKTIISKDNKNTDASENDAPEPAEKSVAPIVIGKPKEMGDIRDFDDFREITRLLRNTIEDDTGCEERELSLDNLERIIPIYREFYSEYGDVLSDGFSDYDSRADYVKRQYIEVTHERGNDRYFEGREFDTFKSHAHTTYIVFLHVADMVNNIVKAIDNKEADGDNLYFGTYVLFNPIIEGKVSSGEIECLGFCRAAVSEILKVLENAGIGSPISTREEEEKLPVGEKYNEENGRKLANVVEKALEDINIDDLNEAVRVYNAISRDNESTRKRVYKNIKSKEDTKSELYGRYTVTHKSIQMMEKRCAEFYDYIDSQNNIYEKSYKQIGEKAFVLNGISRMTGIMERFKKGVENPEDMNVNGKINWAGAIGNIFMPGLDVAESMEDVFPDIPLIKTKSIGLVKNIAGFVNKTVQVLNFSIPFIKKNNKHTRMMEEVWEMARVKLRLPHSKYMADKYAQERASIINGIPVGTSGNYVSEFSLLHVVASGIKDADIRNSFEAAAFSAFEITNSGFYDVKERNINKRYRIHRGLLLNLIRSGMTSKQGIDSKTANEIVDKLYDLIISKQNIMPQTELDPGSRVQPL